MSTRERQQLEDECKMTPVPSEDRETLRAVICVCRHGDRQQYVGLVTDSTPKQKLKFKVSTESLLEKLQQYEQGVG